MNKPKSMNIVLAAETEDFDDDATKEWNEEGFRTAYVPLLKGGNAFIDRVHKTGDAFGASEYYAIVGNANEPVFPSATHNKLTGVEQQPTAMPHR